MKGFVYAQSPARTQMSPMSTPSHHHRTFYASIIEEDLLYAEQIIKRWDLDSQFDSKLDSLFNGDRREARQFVKSVNNLHSSMHFFKSESESSEKIIHAQKLMQVAMKRLGKEFYQILSANRDVITSDSVSNRLCGLSVSEENIVSETVMADLKLIADCMICCGYGKECVKIYIVLRKSIVDETMYNLGVEKYSLNQINKMDWDVIESKMKTWLHAEKIAVKSLFHGERILCDDIFSSSEKIRESCFSEICKEPAITLFEFPELVAKSRKSMERMFRTLDLYSAISDHWPEIETIFDFESTATVRTQAITALVKLGDAIRAMLTDFEASVQKETLKTPVYGGGIHPLTRYVMNYLVFLSDYIEVLTDILADWPFQIQSPLPEPYCKTSAAAADKDDDSSSSSSISDRFAWLVLVLLCKIDSGAELYSDVAQSYLFLLNNMSYILSKIRNSKLKNLFSDNWLEKHDQQMKQYAGNYERMAWSKVISSLPASCKLSVENAGDCFRKFNIEFNEAYRRQSACIISDSKIRDGIKVSLASKILPTYRMLYEKFRGVFGDGDSVVKYAPDDLANYISDLFHGAGGPGSINTASRSSSSSSSSSFSRIL